MLKKFTTSFAILASVFLFGAADSAETDLESQLRQARQLQQLSPSPTTLNLIKVLEISVANEKAEEAAKKKAKEKQMLRAEAASQLTLSGNPMGMGHPMQQLVPGLPITLAKVTGRAESANEAGIPPSTSPSTSPTTAPRTTPSTTP